MKVINDIAVLRGELSDRPRPRAVVMTMGALHEGHAELMREARKNVGASGTVVVTIFVNPTQFGPGEDFDRYPRTLEDDVLLCSQNGVDIIFAPTVEQMYSAEPEIRLSAGPKGTRFEGASRPGHFDGVVTVVTKLFNIVDADVAMFGEKDFQQLAIIRQLVADLLLQVDVVGVATVRDVDGLAMSSRNRFLSADERRAALVLPHALRAAATKHSLEMILATARRVLEGEPAITVDYLEVVDPQLGPAPDRGPARLLVAATVGSTRLIDNIAVQIGGSA